MDPNERALALRAQVLSALRELLRGFQDADRRAEHRLLRGHEDRIYAGLVSVLMRMVFVLFAEGHGLLPRGPDPCSLARLHDELQQDQARHGRAMDDRHGAWARVVASFRLLHQGAGGRIFDPDTYPFLEGRAPGCAGPAGEPSDLPRITDGTVIRVLDRLILLDGERVTYGSLDVEHVGSVYEGLVGFEVEVARPPEPVPTAAFSVQPSEDRRRAGAHYTSRAITRTMVERTLRPLLREAMSADEILALRVCDPAMGSGAFLVEACRQLAEHLVLAWERAQTTPALPAGEAPSHHARRLVAERCLYGVDRDPLAVDVARLSLWLVAFARERPFTFVDHALRHGDALVGLTREQIAGVALDAGQSRAAATTRASVARAVEEAGPGAVRAMGDLLLAIFFGAPDKRARARAMASVGDLVEPVLAGRAGPWAERLLASFRERHVPFHWEVELPEVFGGGRGGFDAIVGNPPWVSYAGRAAQPIADELRDFYAATSPAFHGYRNLQGVFVHRAAAMLRPGGRLGLVLPTSMSDLGGYEPSRRAHDALSACDDELPDFGNKVFEGVFQPSMGLLSTRRPRAVAVEAAGPWPLGRSDLDGEASALLEKLGALPRLPPHLFGDRGFQTTGDDVSRLHELSEPTGELTLGIRVGGDIQPFLRRPPVLYCDGRVFGARLRPEASFQTVKLLIRQTARYPMVALSDGKAFRNSILAGFSDGEHSEHLLLAYLNSTPIRWFHYMRHRDARQGMPQMKIGHLRSLPAPSRSAPGLAALEQIGRGLGERNAGVSAEEQQAIDALVAEALGLDASARARIAAWAGSVRG